MSVPDGVVAILGGTGKEGQGLALRFAARGRPVILQKTVLFLDQEEDNEALGRLWARARIHRLERELHDGMREEVKNAIVDLGLRHRLMTPWTSLVAVDSLVSNDSAPGLPVSVPVEMPEDVAYEGILGGTGALAASKVAYQGLAPMSVPATALPAARFDAPRARAEESLRESAGRGVGGRDEKDRDVREEASKALPRPGSEPRAVTFTRITLVRADGARLVVQADGEVWLLQKGSRRLVHSVSASELDELQGMLAGAGVLTRSGTISHGSRLEIVGDWGAAGVSLPSTDPDDQRLVSLIESFDE